MVDLGQSIDLWVSRNSNRNVSVVYSPDFHSHRLYCKDCGAREVLDYDSTVTVAPALYDFVKAHRHDEWVLTEQTRAAKHLEIQQAKLKSDAQVLFETKKKLEQERAEFEVSKRQAILVSPVYLENVKAVSIPDGRKFRNE